VKKRKLRIISKIGLLFVVIGFFLPMSCNLNGFQIARTFETFGGPNILSISLYSIFIFACIGLILLAALLMKKKFSIGYDWADLIIIITAFSVFMYGQLQSSDDPFLALFSRLQSGAYIIFIGLVGALCFLIEATNKKAKNKDVHGTTQSEIASDKIFIGETVLSENTIKKIKIREELFKKIKRMEKIGTIFSFILGILIGFFLILFLFLQVYNNYDGEPPFYIEFLLLIPMLICGYIGLIIASFFTRLIFFILMIIYDKKIFVYWNVLKGTDSFLLDNLLLYFSYVFFRRKSKKKHRYLSSLWYDWDYFYRKGKYQREQRPVPGNAKAPDNEIV